MTKKGARHNKEGDDKREIIIRKIRIAPTVKKQTIYLLADNFGQFVERILWIQTNIVPLHSEKGKIPQ
jgi:hypothetical protein